MERIFIGQYMEGTSAASSNFCAISRSPMAVHISETYRPFIHRYLASTKLSSEEIADQMDRFHEWYGIIDG